MPSGSGQVSDAATFSNLDPNTSDAETMGGKNTRVIWGTNISLLDTLHAMKDFYLNFQQRYRMYMDGEASQNEQFPAEHPANAKVYVEMMNGMLELDVRVMNLDVRNLKAYPPTRKLWHQIQQFPEEIIPIMDTAVKDVMIELAEKKVNELRRQQAIAKKAPGRQQRDSSSLPPVPSSDAELDGQPQTVVNIPDLAGECEQKMFKVRPFGLDDTINLRELNPGGEDASTPTTSSQS